MDMEIAVKSIRSVTLIEASGFIDGNTAPSFQEKILQVLHESDAILISLAQVSFMSSAGLRALLVAHQKSAASKAVALAELSDNVRDIMETTGYLHYFQVFETVESGMEALMQHHGKN